MRLNEDDTVASLTLLDKNLEAEDEVEEEDHSTEATTDTQPILVNE